VRRGALVLRAVAAALVLGSIAVGLLLLMPAMTGLDSAAGQAAGVSARLADLEDGAAGEAFERELGSFVQQRREKIGEIDLARSQLASRLDAPFREAKIAEGATAPTPEEFQRSYNFHGDQLRTRIREMVGRAGGAEVREISLLTPPFSSGPMDAATMAKWQRSANIEARVFETAAKNGAPPAAMIRLEAEPAPADDPDPAYDRVRIGLELLCPEGRTSSVVHALLGCFEDAGGIAKLVGLAEVPLSETRLKEASGPPAKRLSVSLALGFPSPRSEPPK
jgi:hypothetical protein